jgi:alpha-tubulin suppressor-like RCC1 family protein
MTRPIGGFITATNRAPNASSAMGVWTLDNAMQYTKACLWPGPAFPGGILYAWGTNINTDKLGIGTTTNKSSPVAVVGNFTNWCDISAGSTHALAIRVGGTLWAWGQGSCGALGINSTATQSSPVSVVGGFTDWCQISAGLYNSLAIRQNGTAWGWGLNGCQLGDGTATNRSSPVSVVGGFTDWCQVSRGVGGAIHSLGVRQNGTAWAWGGSQFGVLGNGSSGNYAGVNSPVSVIGGFTDWCQVSAGFRSSQAVRQNGTAWGWGYNGFGNLGAGSGGDKSSPVSVLGGFTDWCQVSVGGASSVATAPSLGLRQNGTLWAWGPNTVGVLGDGTTNNKNSPVSVIGGFTDWCQISAGGAQAIAVRQNGSAWAWGFNNCGQLGDNTTVNKSSPVSVGGNLNWYKVSAGAWRYGGSSFGIVRI